MREGGSVECEGCVCVCEGVYVCGSCVAGEG